MYTAALHFTTIFELAGNYKRDVLIEFREAKCPEKNNAGKGGKDPAKQGKLMPLTW